MNLKAKALLSGLATYLPVYHTIRPTGGTGSARYCYSVWLRHLVLANSAVSSTGIPMVVAEIGPGDSIGIGLAALLSGAEKYHAFDVVAYSDLGRNLAIFDELVELFKQRERIPGGDEFPSLYPHVPVLDFPSALFDDAKLALALDAARVADIRRSIANAQSGGSRISYFAPWTARKAIETGTVDMIYSQAVLEHVDDLDDTYGAMRRWLKPDGVMSHQIDYRSHGKADAWNGHWTYSDLVWKVVVGKRPYLLNRVTHSEQLRKLQAAGFEIVREIKVKSDSGIRRSQLARRFSSMTDEDLVTSGAYVAAKPSMR